MTRDILHAIKKLLRVGVVAVTVISGSINASAQGTIPDLCSTSCNKQLIMSLDPIMIRKKGGSVIFFPLLDKVVVEIESKDAAYLDVTHNKNLVNSFNNSIPSAIDNYGTPILTFQDLEGNYNYSNPNFKKKLEEFGL